MAQKEAERVQMIINLDDWVAVFAENAIFDEDKGIDTCSARDGDLQKRKHRQVTVRNSS